MIMLTKTLINMNKSPLILRTFNQPTSLHIIGNNFENLEETVGITDDYTSFWVKTNDKLKIYDTSGLLFIMTDSEFKQHEDIMRNEEQCHLFIKDYVGDIGIKVIDDIYSFDCNHNFNDTIKLINESNNYLPKKIEHLDKYKYLYDYYNNSNKDYYPDIILEINCSFNKIIEIN